MNSFEKIAFKGQIVLKARIVLKGRGFSRAVLNQKDTGL